MSLGSTSRKSKVELEIFVSNWMSLLFGVKIRSKYFMTIMENLAWLFVIDRLSYAAFGAVNF